MSANLSRLLRLVFEYRETDVLAILALDEPVQDDEKVVWTGVGSNEFAAGSAALLEYFATIGNTNAGVCEQGI